MSTFRVLASILALGFGLGYPQASSAQGLTSTKFLAWASGEQNSYIDLAVQMVGFMASQTDGSQARCINDWYLVGDGTRERKIKHIVDTMRQFPDHHPGIVVIAVLQKACGSFKYAKPQG